MSNAVSIAKGRLAPELVRDETLAAVFAATVSRDPERRAIHVPTRAMNYAQLDAAAEAVAAGLREHGARAGRFVGLWMPRGADVLIAQIAIAKTGAAWIPFDADAPPDRVETCLEDVGALGVVTPAAWREKLPATAQVFAFEPLSRPDLPAVRCDARPSDPAYAIYTSGSTGKPKGILITQANICHFLRAAADRYGLGGDDVMLQAGSIAFDLSLEEIWLPYLVGAQLELCPPEVLTDPDRLAALIADAGVTAMDVVPTLLALLPDELPSVRLIIVGGEACPPSVVERFAVGGRRLINSYGPSETTVVATAAELNADEPVTIGRPLPNTTCYVVDDQLQLLPRGAEGELLIGGAGVAAGYIGRPQLTAEKFIANPFSPDGVDPVLYRSGDAVMMTDAGDLLFRGRIDDQVKLRGFRIELGEIESELASLPAVAQATVVVAQAGGVDRLVGFVVVAAGQAFDEAKARAALAAKLPPYMVPGAILTVDTFPRLAASGKVDRAALARQAHIDRAPVGEEDEVEPPASETERVLRQITRELLPAQPIAPDADFFFDLGGHSLIAAQLVSAARKGGLAHMTLGQIYEGRTLRRIAVLVDEARLTGATVAAEPAEDPRVVARRRFWCAVAQAAAMPFLLTMQSAPWLAIFISYSLVSPESSSLGQDSALVFAAFAAINLALALLAIPAKWLIIGRTKPGRYPLWGAYYFRLWLVHRLLSLVHMKWMQNSPILPLYLRAIGAKVGPGALISDFDAGALDLLHIGANASVGSKVAFANARISGTTMVVGHVRVGDDAAIGSSCAIEGDVEIGRGAEVGDLTALAEGTRVPAGEAWDGSPGARVGSAAPPDAPPPPETALGAAARGIVYFLMLLVLPAISILPIVPAFRVMEWLDTFVNPVLRINYLWYMPLLALSAGAGMVIVTLLLIVAARWIVLPRVRPGRFPVTGNFYIRRWGMGLLIEAALDTLSSLFATLYMRAWYRMMGTKIGKGTEISTSFAGRYELIELGAGNFIADDVVLGDDKLRSGWLELERTRTGDQVFIGNEAVVPQGYTIGDGALIGVKSRPPEGGSVEAKATWFGSPAMQMPQRQRFEQDARVTFSPPLGLKIGRALFEAFNVSLPTALFITLVTAVMEVLAPVFDRQNWGKALWICVLASVVIALVQLVVAVAYKWLLMGRYRPTIKPMWSWWALRTEAVAVMYWGMAGKALLEPLRGTPFLPLALRLFGVKTGRGIYLDSADITEFDCVRIGDGAVVNNHAVLQTHLYEDRVMKVGRISIGAGAVIGANSTVLYDTDIGDGARLGPLTLVMKGEHIPANAHFAGAPARPA